MKQIVSFLSLFIFLALSGMAQQADFLSDPGEGLKIATLYYENGQYHDAYQKFAALAERFPSDGHNSIFRFMAAKSLYMAGDYRQSIVLWNDFVATFPGSNYIGEARLFKGHCLYKLGELPEAAGEYIEAIDFDPRGNAAPVARENLTPLVSRGLTMTQISRLIADHPGSHEIDMMQFTLAKRELDAGRYRKGARAFQAYLRQFPGGKYAKQARALLEEAETKARQQFVIGLLAPISGGFEEYGRSMVEGARLALKKLGADSLQISLDVRDAQSGPIVSTRAAASLANEEPIAVVGPLTSEASVGAAVVLNDRGIPMITPTASESGLSTIGPNVFQVSPSIEHIGQAIASYAVQTLNIKEFAIIAPDDASGQKIAKAFSQEVYDLGGEVISTAYYAAGATDFKQQIMPLRDILLAKTEEQLATGELDSSKFLDPKTEETLDKEEWPVELGGMFLPGYPDDLKMLIPQVRYHIIRTRFLGSDGWDSDDLTREVKRYAGDAVFATDFHVDQTDPAWIQFAKEYAAAYSHQPDKVAALTYDAVALILNGLRQGKNTPDDMRGYLSNIANYQGVSCVITFKGTDRSNSEVGVYSIDGRKLAYVD